MQGSCHRHISRRPRTCLPAIGTTSDHTLSHSKLPSCAPSPTMHLATAPASHIPAGHLQAKPAAAGRAARYWAPTQRLRLTAQRQQQPRRGGGRVRAEADGGSQPSSDAAAANARPAVPQLSPAEAQQKIAELDKLLASEGPQVEAQAASLAATLHEQGALQAFGAASQVCLLGLAIWCDGFLLSVQRERPLQATSFLPGSTGGCCAPPPPACCSPRHALWLPAVGTAAADHAVALMCAALPRCRPGAEAGLHPARTAAEQNSAGAVPGAQGHHAERRAQRCAGVCADRWDEMRSEKRRGRQCRWGMFNGSAHLHTLLPCRIDLLPTRGAPPSVALQCAAASDPLCRAATWRDSQPPTLGSCWTSLRLCRWVKRTDQPMPMAAQVWALPAAPPLFCLPLLPAAVVGAVLHLLHATCRHLCALLTHPRCTHSGGGADGFPADG